MKILNLLFAPTNIYHEMPLRPYTMLKPGREGLNVIRRHVQDHNYDAETMSQVANLILRPCRHPVQPAYIPNGWGERRYRFIMHVQHGEDLGGQRMQFLTGYTDYCGTVVKDGRLSFDPDMQLHFNNIIDYKRTVDTDGRVLVSDVRGASHVLTDYSFHADFQLLPTSLMHALRPEDILRGMEYEYLRHLGDDVFDMRPTFLDCRVKKSSRLDTLTGVYASRIIESYRDAMATLDEDERCVVGALNSAASAVSNQSVKHDPFLQIAAGNSDFHQRGCMTYQELMTLPGSIAEDQVVVVSPAKQPQIDLNDTSAWADDRPYANTAYLVGMGVPSIMADNLLGEVAFHATNDTVSGQYDMVLTQVTSLVGYDLVTIEQLNVFKDQLLKLVMPTLTYYNGDRRIVDIQGTFDLCGDSMIKLRIRKDGSGRPAGDTRIFRMPTFADARFSPVIASDAAPLRKFAEHMAALLPAFEGSIEVD